MEVYGNLIIRMVVFVGKGKEQRARRIVVRTCHCVNSEAEMLLREFHDENQHIDKAYCEAVFESRRMVSID